MERMHLMPPCVNAPPTYQQRCPHCNTMMRKGNPCGWHARKPGPHPAVFFWAIVCMVLWLLVAWSLQ
jgi:hypothetical protein